MISPGVLAAIARSALETGFPMIRLVEEPGGRGLLTPIRGGLLHFFTGFSLADPYSLVTSQLPLAEILGSSEPEWTASPPGTSSGLGGEGEGAGEVVIPPREEEITPPVLTGKEPVIGIYHTHSRESYLPEFPNYKKLKPDDAHSYDFSITVVRVGEELARALNEKYGLGVVQSRFMNDREGKLGAYIKSLVTAQKLLKEHPSLRILLDVHRDSQRRSITTAIINGQPVARVMLVVGTFREAGDPPWIENQAFANEIIKIMDEKYPGLSRGIFLENYRFNQHLAPGSVILEMGGVDNTLEEVLRSARLMAEVLAEVIRKGKAPSR